jgi:hypothetical protein
VAAQFQLGTDGTGPTFPPLLRIVRGGGPKKKKKKKRSFPFQMIQPYGALIAGTFTGVVSTIGFRWIQVGKVGHHFQGSMLRSQSSATFANLERKNWRFSQKPML